MASPPPPLRLRRGSPPALFTELIEEILFRLPPDEPAHLFRAALVCKAWCNTISDGGFLRRYREFHRTPPLLGYFFHDTLHRPRLVSTATPVPLAKPPPASRVTDCRHGRVLIEYGHWRFRKLVVWDPITGHTKHVTLMPPKHYYSYSYAAAVICAAGDDSCDHLACHGGPFRVVLVHSSRSVEGGHAAHAIVYSSATGAWSTTEASVHCSVSVGRTRSRLIGDALYFTLKGGRGMAGVLKYDLAHHALSVIDTLRVLRNAIAVRAEDGGLGFLEVLRNRIYLISSRRQANGGGWVRHKSIKLKTLLPKSSCHPHVIGFVESTDGVLLRANGRVFVLELKSRLVKRVSANKGSYFIAYTSFYTPDFAKGRASPPLR